MAITRAAPAPKLLTYERYMAEEINRRYDIIDGVRIFMPGANWKHQRVQINATEGLRGYEKMRGDGYVMVPPFDVLIRRRPKLRTRQPDILYITKAQLERGGGVPKVGRLEVAPELVVEILSDSETKRRLDGKVKDYIAIGVKECWVLRPEARTVAVLRLTPNGPETVAVYDETQTLQSVVFPDLTLPVADFFKE